MMTATHTPELPRILVIDDEPLIARVLNRALRRGFEVVVCSTAIEAKELLSAGASFDVILSDMMMPNFSGMDLFEWLRETAPDQADRLFFTSGGAFTDRAAHYQTTMADRFIQKPFNIRGISKTLLDFIADNS
jgi:DNA-binding response OmpR family regulator